MNREEEEDVVPEKPLQVRLEVTDQRSGQYALSFDTFQYPIALNLEAITFNDWLRRLRTVLVGKTDPSGELSHHALLRNVGTWLWRVLFPESAPTQEREALAYALRTGNTPLLLELPTILAGLPWELLCDPEQSDGEGFLASRRPLIRLSASAIALPPIELPLRVLLLISSPLSLGEDSRVDVESERVAVEQATRKAREEGKLHLRVEDIVTVQRVEDALTDFQPHIVHYIGHGVYNAAMGGALLWEDEQGNEFSISDRRLAAIFSYRNLRAVVLHGCETGRSNARADVHSLAETLVNKGIPAVLAQQANFTYESSRRTSEVWYMKLTAGQGFAEALLAVRQALIQADHPDWAVPILQGSIASLAPVLTTTSHPGLTDPMLTSLRASADLPTPVRVFAGRHRELRALCLMLESAPGSGPVMALITGPGGMGKSTLVAQAVTRYGGTYKAALTLRCQDYHGLDLFLQQIGEFLKRLDVPDFLEEILPDPKLSTEAKIEKAIVALNEAGPVLLMIDNLESVQNDDQTMRDEALLHLLQELLATLRGGRVLVTGRYAVKDLLPHGNVTANLLQLEIGDLSTYETNQLLMRYPTLARLSELVREKLILEFGGFPYTYDLLSSKAAAGDLERILYEVRKYGTSEQKQPTKEQTRREEWQKVHGRVTEFAALGAIVNRLSETSQALLAQLVVLHRPFPIAAVEQGLGTTQIVLQPLLDWALLHYDPQMKTYHLHSLTRRYVESLLAEYPRRQAQIQLARWYEQYALQDSYDLVDWLEGYRLLLAAGSTQQAGKLVMQLAGRLKQLGLYTLLQDLCAEIRRDIHESDEQLTANVLFELGNIAHLQGKNEDARGFYQQSLDINKRLGNQREQADTLYAFGNLAFSQGKYEEARDFYQQSLGLYDLIGNQHGRVGILHSLGQIAQNQGEYEEARRLYQQSLNLCEQLGLQRQSVQSMTLFQLGKIAQEQGKYKEAHRLYQQSLDLFEQWGDLRGRLMTLQQLGTITYLQGNYEEARDYYQRSLEIDELLKDPIWRAVILHQLGMIAQDQGEYEEAQSLYQQTLDISTQLGDQSGQAGALHQLGMIALQQGKYEEARDLSRQSLNIFESIDEQSKRAGSLQQLGTIAYLQQEYEEAQALSQQSLIISERLGNLREFADSLHMLALIAQQQKKYEEAYLLSEQSLGIFERLGNPRGRANAFGLLSALAYEQGNVEKALMYMIQAYMLLDALDAYSRTLIQSNITRIRSIMGEVAFAAHWRIFTGNHPLPALSTEDTQQLLLQTVIDFIDAPTWDISKSILESHPELLQPEADALLQNLALELEQDEARKVIEEHRLLLALCVEKGIDAAFAALKGWQFVASILRRLPRWKRK